MEEVKLNEYTEKKPKFFLRIIWSVINRTIFRLLIGKRLFFARNFLLRLFGAKLHSRVLIYSSCDIFEPWNLEVDKFSCLGPNTEIYNKAKIKIGANAVISQDISEKLLPLTFKDITIGDQSWIAADVFIGPGVTIGEGAVVGARAAVFKDVDPWTVVGGNPAKFLKKRVLSQKD